ncbi:MAG: tetratricopeptide repeat protein [Deltaproteobacteria bacterium]
MSVALLLYAFLTLLYGRRVLSFLAAVFFTAHPAQTEAVAYISCRADLLSAFFILLCLFLYVKQAASRRSAAFYAALLASYVFALLSKEYAVVVLALLPVYSYAFRRRLQAGPYASLAGATLAYLAARAVIMGPAWAAAPPVDLVHRVAGFLAALSGYARILLLPSELHMEYGMPLFGFGDPRVWGGAVLLLAASAAMVRMRGNRGPAFFGLAWFFAALLPVSNIYPLNAYMAEHWLYVPAMGCALVLARGFAFLLEKAGTRRFAAAGLAALLLGAYVCAAAAQNAYWRDPIAFYETTLRYAPRDEKMYTNLGMAYFAAGRMRDSWATFEKLSRINPDNAAAYNGLGNVYDETGEKEKAIRMFEEAIKRKPGFLHAYYNLAAVYWGAGRWREAEAVYNRALKVDPRAREAYYDLGRLHAADSEKAAGLFEKAIEADPDYVPAYAQLARIYAAGGRMQQALSLYEKAAARRLDWSEAYWGLGNVRAGEGRYAQAIALYKKAAQIDPGAVPAYMGLGNAYCALGRNKAAVLSFEKAVEIDPTLGLAYNNLAVACYYSGQYASAVRYADKAVELGYKVAPEFLEMVQERRT